MKLKNSIKRVPKKMIGSDNTLIISPNYSKKMSLDYPLMKTKHPIHEDILEYNIPPENLTYENLLNIFFDDLLNNCSLDLQSDSIKVAEKIAEKIKKKEGDLADFDKYNINTVHSVFNEIIEKKMNECIKKLENPGANKEQLRKNLWNILYTSHFGYLSKYKQKYGDKIDEITIGQAINDELMNDKVVRNRSSKAKSIGGGGYTKYIQDGNGPRDHSPGKPHLPRPPPPHNQFTFKYVHYFPNFIKSVWGFLFKMLNRPLNKLLTGPSEEENNGSPEELHNGSPLIYNHLTIRDELSYLKREIINTLSTPDDIKKINLEFNYIDDIIDERVITYSIYLKRKIEKEKSSFLKKIYSYYLKNRIDAVIYKPFKNLYIYGMQNPDQYDRTKILSIMFFLLEKLKITKFIDLQDCEGGTYEIAQNARMNCNPYDRGAERDMFNLAVKFLLNNKKIDTGITREHKNIKDIVDMTAGSLLAWNEINNLPVATSDNRMIFHCFAGKGRTGTTLLFLRLRDVNNNNFNIKSRLNNTHFGYNTIIDLLNNLKDLFDPLKMSYQNNENNLDINFWKEVKREVFKTKEIWHIKLLRQRLNRIFYFLAKKNKVNTFYLYAIPSQETFQFQQIHNFDYYKSEKSDIYFFFSEPFKVDINWDNFSSEKLSVHQGYIDGIRRI